MDVTASDSGDYPFDGLGGDGQLTFSFQVEPISLQAKKTTTRSA